MSLSTLCKTGNHPWQTTAASNYEICSQESCKAARRYINGEWVIIEKQKRTRKPAQQEQQPASLWS